jgi:hypothetical protein
MKPAATAHQAKQHLRWERLHVAVRCGLHPEQPALVRIYLGVGRWLVQQGLVDARVAHQRMLTLLLETARDDALPWYWRSVCLEHTASVVARLTTLLKHQQPTALQDLVNQVQAAQANVAEASSGAVADRTET